LARGLHPQRISESNAAVATARAATYKIYFRLPQGVNADQLAKKLEPDFIRLRLTTNGRGTGQLGARWRMPHYLNLVAFIALFGSIGVASSARLHQAKSQHTGRPAPPGAKNRSTFAIT
jgi:hypothetical protein